MDLSNYTDAELDEWYSELCSEIEEFADDLRQLHKTADIVQEEMTKRGNLNGLSNK